MMASTKIPPSTRNGSSFEGGFILAAGGATGACACGCGCEIEGAGVANTRVYSPGPDFTGAGGAGGAEDCETENAPVALIGAEKGWPEYAG